MMKALNFFSCVLLALITAIETEKGPVILRRCRVKSDCGSFGYFCGQNETCHCDPLYILNNNGNKCVAGIGQKCRYDEHCIEGAFCKFQMSCQCKDDLYPSEDGFACSKSPRITTCDPHLLTIGIMLYHCLKII